MNEEHATTRAIPAWTVFLVAVAALVLAAVALTATVIGSSPYRMMVGSGMMGGTGMMGDGPAWMAGDLGAQNGPQPGASGFVAGTVASPRVIHVIAGPGYGFTPSTIAVASGETVMFLVTTMGPTVHEFMVGPADAVATDAPGSAEIADIGMMRTKSLTYTFDGSGPYAFACHVDGHYEAGMRGTITLVE